jgi:TRAP-type C4-dicarboxylate transport system permease small subunit
MYKRIVLASQRFTHAVDTVNNAVGHVAMYLLVVMMGILLWSVFTNTLNKPAIWVMEMAQFTMAAYYLVGAAFSMQQGAHVRMDFLYERWGKRKRSLTDSITSVCLLFYLALLVWGGWESSTSALTYGQRNHTVWAPYMAPIKIIMTSGMALMLLQALSELVKDLFRACGKELHAITFEPEYAYPDGIPAQLCS